jgi:hypothetical protein
MALILNETSMKYPLLAAQLPSLLLASSLLMLGCSTAEAPAPVADSTASSTASSAGAEATDPAANPDASTTETGAETGAASDKAPSKEEGVDQKNVKLSIKDQTTAGQIVVELVETSRDGWVSVHKSKSDGSIQAPDSIGEARVDSGENKDIVVDLWESPAVGDKLWVLLHIDAGEHGLYEFPGTDVPVLKNGETMARSFVIKADKKAEEAEEAE